MAAGLALPLAERGIFLDRLRKGVTQVRSGRLIRQAREKLDYMSMLYQRRLSARCLDEPSKQWCCTMGSDASRVSNTERFCTSEDRMIWKGPCEQIAQQTSAEGLAHVCLHLRRTLPPTVLSAGATDASHKLEKFCHVLTLGTGGEEPKARSDAVVTWLADQGTEIVIGMRQHRHTTPCKPSLA